MFVHLKKNINHEAEIYWNYFECTHSASLQVVTSRLYCKQKLTAWTPEEFISE